MLSNIFKKEEEIAEASYQKRWKILLVGCLYMSGFGILFAWSVISERLVTERGVVTKASSDWSMQQATYPAMITLSVHAIASTLLGSYLNNAGYRTSCFLGGVFLLIGYVIGSMGIYMHNIWITCLGIGVFTGLSQGMAYVPIIGMAQEWFQDKKGIASSAILASFSISGLIMIQLFEWMLPLLTILPVYLGPKASHNVIYQKGVLFVNRDNQLQEVVYANRHDLIARGLQDKFDEGLYLVGSGNTGIAPALLIFGLFFSVLQMSLSFLYKKPHPTYVKQIVENSGGKVGDTEVNVSYEVAVMSKQYLLLVIIFVTFDMQGLALLFIFKSMVMSQLTTALPEVVTTQTTSQWTMGLSIISLCSRLFSGWMCDLTSPRSTFISFSVICLPFGLMIPSVVNWIHLSPSLTLLALYLICISFLIALQGATMTITPAFVADLFGIKNLIQIHGQIYSRAIIASLLGPFIILQSHRYSEENAILQLVTQADPVAFQQHFGSPINDAHQLINSNTLTITKILEILPKDTINPTPFLYNIGIYILQGIIMIGLIAALSIQNQTPQQIIDQFKQNQDQEETQPLVKDHV